MASSFTKPHYSILRRPIRPATPGRHCSTESSDAQWQRERADLDKLRARTDRLKEERASILYGSREQKRTVQKEQAKFMNDHFRHREALKKKESDDERHTTEAVLCHNSMRKITEQSNDETRRKFLQEHMRENMRLAEYRKQLKQREAEQEKQQLHREGNFMDKFGRNPF